MPLHEICCSCCHAGESEDGKHRLVCCHPEADCWKEVNAGRLPVSFEHNYEDDNIVENYKLLANRQSCTGCGAKGHGNPCASCRSEMKWGM